MTARHADHSEATTSSDAHTSSEPTAWASSQINASQSATARMMSRHAFLFSHFPHMPPATSAKAWSCRSGRPARPRPLQPVTSTGSKCVKRPYVCEGFVSPHTYGRFVSRLGLREGAITTQNAAQQPPLPYDVYGRGGFVFLDDGADLLGRLLAAAPDP